MDKDDAIRKLQEFNSEAMELFRLRFVKDYPGSSFSINWKKGEGFKTEFKGPDDESIKALCNDVRKFIQGNDTLKIEKLVPVYQSDFVGVEERKIFNKAMSELGTLKKTESPHRVNGEALTNQKVLEVFLYGKMSHRTEGTKEIYDVWTRSPGYVSMKYTFVRILCKHVRILNNICCANNMILEKFGYPKIMLGSMR